MEINLITHTDVCAPEWSRADAALRALLATTGRSDLEIAIVLTDDDRIRDLNLEWRGIDQPTDVLSWPQEVYDASGDFVRGWGPGPLVLGDIVISVDTAKKQAREREWDLPDEIALLAVHGALHLLGFEDETDAGAEAMRAVERRILGKPLDKVFAAPG